MANKYKASINKPGSGAYTDVYTEANNQIDAERIFKALYPGHDVWHLHKLEEESESSSSSSGCASVIALFALLPLSYLLVRLAA